MDFSTALNIKQAISATFLRTIRSARRIISFNSSITPIGSNVQKTLLESVNGVGVGQKANGENFVKVLTRDKLKLSTSLLSKYYGMPATAIVVEEAGLIKLRTPTGVHRPPFPGISVAHYKVTAGTLGCFVQDDKKKIYILSNNHVLANSNKGKYKDPILQPGLMDGGKRTKDVIAHLSYLVELDRSGQNRMDAAIAEIMPGLSHEYGFGKKKITGVTEPVNGMKVEKLGRSTGLTKGRITTRNLDIQVDFGGKAVEFIDQFEVKGNRGTMFCDSGDSGALIYVKETMNAVGLLFAGTNDGTTFATPISEVLDTFSVRIL
ncbi:S1 family peptidase [Terrimonas sp. NA20]|uniref:S1 family peptidase n=1 Tax=Terrimonas ginsenosidimutans TaxID=2908004 RepID=A0ABS9KWS7_9BACT|nr:S1 family peptidase [Terrimonas ginsenosidimutans]MCG2616814.1 S1 family peptidase [Terrimonas ginsenosidimutans]